MSKLFDAIDWNNEYVEKVGKEIIEENLASLAEETKNAQYSFGYREVMESIKSRDTYDGYEIDYQCPICKQGTITYWKEDTPGFRDSGFNKCTKCGFGMHKFIDVKKDDKI
ncbi:hypothetical protein ACT9XH_02845 [Methanococcoides methylutens]|uniref:hypothetical protein n=1 Tax=Methanococcoides methylutens TaxID=2226 RepID=UPI0040444A6E